MSCNGYRRHWFTMFGVRGLRTPICSRCRRELNPTWTAADQREWDRMWAKMFPEIDEIARTIVR